MASVRIEYCNGESALFENATVRPTDSQYLILNTNGKVRVRIGRGYVYAVDRNPAPWGFHYGNDGQGNSTPASA